jgi:hypothetical protein
MRLRNDLESMGKDHVYHVGFYTILYIQVRIQSWHTWPSQKKTTSGTRFHVQDWHWIGYIA